LRRVRQVWRERVPRSGVFISYAHKDDQSWLDNLLGHLSWLKQHLQKLIERHPLAEHSFKTPRPVYKSSVLHTQGVQNATAVNLNAELQSGIFHGSSHANALS
jgi:hypothetical protein